MGGRIDRRLVVVVSVAATLVAVVALSGRPYDFAFDWIVANEVLEGGDPSRPLRDLAADRGLRWDGLDFVHPRTPGALLLIAPVEFLPGEWTYLAGRIAVVASAFGLAAVMARLVGRPFWQTAALVPAAMVVWPFSEVLQSGQTGFLVAALLGATYLAGDRPGAGVPLGLAVVLKL